MKVSVNASGKPCLIDIVHPFQTGGRQSIENCSIFFVTLSLFLVFIKKSKNSFFLSSGMAVGNELDSNQSEQGVWGSVWYRWEVGIPWTRVTSQHTHETLADCACHLVKADQRWINLQEVPRKKIRNDLIDKIPDGGNVSRGNSSPNHHQ